MSKILTSQALHGKSPAGSKHTSALQPLSGRGGRDKEISGKTSQILSVLFLLFFFFSPDMNRPMVTSLPAMLPGLASPELNAERAGAAHTPVDLCKGDITP